MVAFQTIVGNKIIDRMWTQIDHAIWAARIQIVFGAEAGNLKANEWRLKGCDAKFDCKT